MVGGCSWGWKLGRTKVQASWCLVVVRVTWGELGSEDEELG